MTFQNDLQKAIASCEAAKGSYSMMTQSTEDQQAIQMFTEMKSDIDKHMQYLNNRLNYLNQNNELNKHFFYCDILN